MTLFRDNHAWCPYCQKVWLWLEEKQVPYKIAKVTMFCVREARKLEPALCSKHLTLAADRLSISLTLVLTVAAFKFAVSQMTPSIA